MNATSPSQLEMSLPEAEIREPEGAKVPAADWWFTYMRQIVQTAPGPLLFTPGERGAHARLLAKQSKKFSS